MLKIVCFGEVLWDIFPTYKIIGGAPLNVALRLNSFDVKTSIISRIGNDDNGREILEYIKENRMDNTTVQIDKIHKTGCVNVTLDENGSASYEIEHPVAWDKIEITDRNVAIVKSSDAFVFGSLACRDEVSKNSLLNLLQHAKYRVFDVNLRPPFYSMDLLLDLMKKADFIKCNDEELLEICNALNFRSESIENNIKSLSEYTQTNQLCITLGKDGAVFFNYGKFYRNRGYQVLVNDTVGAGDSFLATLINNLLLNLKPIEALDIACATGALVASKKGANPKLTNIEILKLMKKRGI